MNAFLIESSEKSLAYGLQGSKGNYFKLSPAAYHLLSAVEQGVSFETLAAALSQQQKQEVLPDDVAKAYQHIVQKINHLESTYDVKRSGFWFRLTLIPQEKVRYLAKYLAPLFHPLAAVLVILTFLVVLTTFMFNNDGWQHIFPTSLTSLVLFILSLVGHELGHAAASYRYGAMPREIGFGVYLIYPAAYSDVTAAWQLKRWQRVVVAIGGVYFQLILGTLFVLCFQLFGWSSFDVAFGVIWYSCLLSLIPVFKLDGYWMVSDALGVTNLSQQPRRLFRYYLARWQQRATKPLPWSPATIGLLLIYTVFSLTVGILFFSRSLPMLWQSVLNYPGVVAAFFNKLWTVPASFTLEDIGLIAGASLEAFVFVVVCSRLSGLLWRQRSQLKAGLLSLF